MERNITTLGTKIRVNKGQIETLVQLERPYGVFKSDTYQVVRNISHIRDKEILQDESAYAENLIKKDYVQTSLFGAEM